MFNTARPQGPGLPAFLVPKFAGGFSQHTIAINARNSMIGLLFKGPDIGKFRSGGRISAVFFDNTNVFADNNGFMLTQAYGELSNDKWRFAAGLQLDVFAPNLPTVLPFSVDGAPVGNTIKGQIRVERYLKLGSDSQLTLQGAVSEPLNSIKTPDVSLDEDNGKPNAEGRIAFELGTPAPIGIVLTQRPVEVGLSGVVGQLRRTSFPNEPPRRVVSNVWGVNVDFRVNLAGRYGFKGEVYTGQGLGQTAGAILQSLDAVTWEAIRSTGGWVEGFVYLTPNLHSHTGIAMDDANEDDITAIPNTLFGRTYNRVFYSTLLWDLTRISASGSSLPGAKPSTRNQPPRGGAQRRIRFPYPVCVDLLVCRAATVLGVVSISIATWSLVVRKVPVHSSSAAGTISTRRPTGRSEACGSRSRCSSRGRTCRMWPVCGSQIGSVIPRLAGDQSWNAKTPRRTWRII